MKKYLVLMILSLALASPAFSQTWFRVASEPDVVGTSTSVTWRYGAGSGITSAGVDCSIAPGCWAPQVTGAIASTSISDATDGFVTPDPAPYVAKELDILETVVAQTVTVNGVAKIVPALPPPPSYPAVIVTPGTVMPMAYGKVTIIPGSPLSQILPLVNLPPFELMATVLQNFSFKLTFEGIVFDCTFAGVSADGTVSQNCIGEPIPSK
jgi:hypothetical protein